MRIDTIRAPSVAQAKRSERRSSVSGFSSLVDADDQMTTSSVAAPVAAASLASLIDAQMLDQEAGQKQRQQQMLANGHEALDLLTVMQRALAMGATSVTLLQNLAAMAARQGERSNDPQLDEIMAEIELRLAVETARLEMANG